MIDGRKVLAVVPARGGSKGIPLKNLREVGGVPLVTLAGQVAGKVPCIDRKIVSTDHEDIAEAARAGGLDAPFMRPEDISGDRIGDQEVLSQALSAIEEIDGVTYDIIVMLQPTSPLRTPAHVGDTIAKLVEDNLDAVWTVSESDSKHHPLKQLTVEDGKLGYYDPEGANIIARQQLGSLYHRNGLAYAMTRHCLMDLKSIKGERCGAVVCEDGPFISIDTEWDLKLTEFVLRERQ